MSEHAHDHDDHSTTPEGEVGDTSGGDHNTMQMWFHFGMNETLLFRFWKTGEGHPTAFALSLTLVFALAFFYEALKFGREKLHHWGNTRKKTENLPTINKSRDSPSINAQDDLQAPSLMTEILDVHHVLQTITYVVQLLLSYCLMLVFMSFNVWFCSAIIVGAALGHLFFGWYKSGTGDSKSSSTHCQ